MSRATPSDTSLLVSIAFTDDTDPGEVCDNINAHFHDSMRHSVRDTNGNLKSANRSHSLKRHAVEKLQEHLSPHTFVDRCGFIVKNLHTMFDYFQNSAHQDEKSALILANWLYQVDSVIQGGIAPDASAIKTAKEKVRVFVDTLFCV